MASDDDIDEVLRGVAAAPAAPPPRSPPAALPGHGARLGPWRLLEPIGEGGMGVVYLAERADAHYQQKVAIKVLRPGSVSPQVIARFRHERQILATLDHPGIVRLLDGGSTSDGIPYLVMEHVEGVSLADRARGLPVRARVELVLGVAKALQYAHQKLVIHRDVKPGNIVVAADGTPKLLDFGIAKLLDPDAQLDPDARTRTGVALLTLEYASPEQVRGEPVSVATDVYSLGAVLYELLVGRPPQQASGDALETLRLICEVDPPRPSEAAPEERRRALAGDLDNIVAKALQKEPSQRYPSVARFGDDLERYLTGLPIAAREATLGYRARKFVGRHRAMLALVALATAALAATTVISVLQARRADGQAARAERQARTLLVEQGGRELAAGHAARALPYLAEALRAGEDGPALRFLVAEALRPLGRELARSYDFGGGLTGLAWSQDGARIAATGFGGGVRIYDPQGRRLAALDGHGAWTMLPTFTKDGRRLAVSNSEGNVELWDLETGALLHVLATTPVRMLIRGSLAFDPAGERLVVVPESGRARLWEVARGVPLLAFDGGAEKLSSCVFSPDGARIACGTDQGVLRIYRARDGALLGAHPGHRGDILQVEFSADGARLYSAGADGTARIRDGRSAAPIALLAGHGDSLAMVDLSRDGRRLVTACFDGTAKLWDAHTGKLQATLVGHTHDVISAARWSPDGSMIVTSGGDRTFRLWDAVGGSLVATIEPGASSGTAPHSGSRAIDAWFSPDGARVVTAAGTELGLWDAGRQPLLAELPAEDRLNSASFSPDERRLAVAGNGGLVELIDVSGRAAPVVRRVGEGRIWDVKWSPRGDRLAIAGEFGVAQILDAQGALLHLLPGHAGAVNRAAFSPDGARVATSGDDHTLRIWNADTGAQEASLQGGDRMMASAWSRDGAVLATAGWDGVLLLWDVAGRRRLRTLGSGGGQLLDLSFSPDQRRLATTAHDGGIDVWDLASGARLLSLEGHSSAVTMVAWSPDGALLASSGDDTTVRIWDAASGRRLATLPHHKAVMEVAFSRDGERLIAADNDKRVRLWDVRRDQRPVSEIAGFLEARGQWRLVDGQLERRSGRQ